MKLSLSEKAVYGLMIVMMIAMPIFAQSGQDEYIRGKMAGEQMAKPNALWFVAGCVGSFPGVLVAYIVQPEVPSVHLMGKSPDYIRGFTEGYKSRTQKKNLTYALYGLGTQFVCCCLYYVAIIGATVSGA